MPEAPVSLDRPVNSKQGSAPMLSALAFFFVLTAYYIVRPLRDQLVGAVGSRALPWIYATTLIVMLALTPLLGWLMARYSRRGLLGWSYGIVVISLIAFMPAFAMQAQIGARNLGIVFFAWVSIFNLIVVTLFWSLMADIFSSMQARRLFSLIAFAGMAGALTGPFITASLVETLGVPPMLGLSAASLALALVILLRLSRGDGSAPADTAEEPIGGSLWAGLRQVLMQPFLRYMAMLMLLGDGIGTLAYALMADYAKANFHDAVARTAFYSNLDLAINGFGALMQLTVTRWLLIRFGAGWGMVVPALANLLLLLMIGIFGVVELGTFHLGPIVLAVSTLSILQVVTRGMAFGMTKPAVDALYTRVAREARYKGKSFIETTVWRLGDVLVSNGLNLLRSLGVGLAGIGLIGAGLSGLAAWLSHQASHSPDLLPEHDGREPGSDQAGGGSSR
jgi:AAA family ATP:ADP antiporter